MFGAIASFVVGLLRALLGWKKAEDRKQFEQKNQQAHGAADAIQGMVDKQEERIKKEDAPVSADDLNDLFKGE